MHDRNTEIRKVCDNTLDIIMVTVVMLTFSFANMFTTRLQIEHKGKADVLTRLNENLGHQNIVVPLLFRIT